jgi:hypothetical protein
MTACLRCASSTPGFVASRWPRISGLSPTTAQRRAPRGCAALFRVPLECHHADQLVSPISEGPIGSAQMRIRTLVLGLAVAAPIVAFESGPAAACDWLFGWGRGYGYTSATACAPGCATGYGCAPRSYYGYSPAYYGGFYGRRWGWGWRGYGWRGYGFRGWRGYGYRGWRGARVGTLGGARVAGFRAGGFRGGVRGRR